MVGHCSSVCREQSWVWWGLFLCAFGPVFPASLSIPCSFSSVPSQDPGRAHCSEGQNKLLSMIKAWQVPPERASLPLVQSAKDLKEILCTAAAFLQGLWGQVLMPAQSPAALSQDHFPCPYPGFSSQANWPLGFFVGIVPLELGLG